MRGPTGIRFQRSTGALDRRVGATTLVSTTERAEVHELSGGASAVWTHLSAPRTLPVLIERLAVEHDASPTDIAGEVESCIDTLLSLGVIEEVQDFDG